MSEPTERDVEALAAIARSLTYATPRNIARAVLISDWYAERIAQARREGAVGILAAPVTEAMDAIAEGAVHDRCADRYIISGHHFRIVANALAAAEREAAELRAAAERRDSDA